MDLELECQLNWYNRNAVTSEILDTLKRTNEDVPEGLSMDEQPWHTSKIPRSLSLVVIDFLEHPEGVAEERLNKILREFEADIEGLTEDEAKVLYYLILANKAVLKFRRIGKCPEVDQMKREATGVDIIQPEQMAMLLAIKGGMIGFFGDREIRISIFNQVVELAPDVPKYWIGLFEAIRRLRRERDHLSEPTDEEMASVRKAYDLAPESTSVLQAMATHYHDIYKVLNHNNQNRITTSDRFKFINEMGYLNFVAEMKSFAKKSFNQNPNSLGAALRLAEILWCGRKSSTQAEIEEAKAQFDFCFDNWPTSSAVLHNVGKFYCVMIDLPKGLELLEKSLMSDPSNFAALMDYLRSFYRTNTDNDQLLKIIDTYYSFHIQRKELISKLACLNATLLANKRELGLAIAYWVNAMAIIPNFWNGTDMGHLFGRNIFNNPYKIKLHDLKAIRGAVQNKILSEAGSDESEAKENLKNFLAAIDREIESSEARTARLIGHFPSGGQRGGRGGGRGRGGP